MLDGLYKLFYDLITAQDPKVYSALGTREEVYERLYRAIIEEVKGANDGINHHSFDWSFV